MLRLPTKEPSSAQARGRLPDPVSAKRSVSPYVRSRGRSLIRRFRTASLLTRTLWVLLTTTLTFILFIALVFPSYSRPPPHYQKLARQVTSSHTAGRANPNHENVFIAASLYDPDGALASGSWGERVNELIQMLGPDHTFLSIYESDSGPNGRQALNDLAGQVECDHEMVAEDEVQLHNPALITLPSGESVVKRIDYLAAARNKALEPLERPNATTYQKVLYLNDVIFDPLEAAQLLFSTNLQSNGRTDYKAACAVDYKNPFVMYDTLATRDLEGRGTGVPIYPYFSSAGSATSRRDMLAQKDAVRVSSCWGGLVAFDGRYFQSSQLADLGLSSTTSDARNAPHHNINPPTSPARFRGESDLFWEYSECCLIHADLSSFAPPSNQHSPTETATGTGILMNPYVRTAYTLQTFNRLSWGRRFERLLLPFQTIINFVNGLPHDNIRRHMRPGQQVSQTVFEHDSASGAGSWRTESLPAKPGGFCGIRNLMIKRLDRNGNGYSGADGQELANWETITKDLWSSMPDA